MCVVSMVMDHYRDRWFEGDRWVDGNGWGFTKGLPYTDPKDAEFLRKFMETRRDKESMDSLREQMEKQEELISVLRREFEEMKQLLARAKEYDVKNNEPECETDEKVQLMLKLADLLGVDPGKVLRGEAK